LAQAGVTLGRSEPQAVVALEEVAAKGKADDKFAPREALDA
jgi:hypothetical protein